MRLWTALLLGLALGWSAHAAETGLVFTSAGRFGGRTSAVDVQGNYLYYSQAADLIVRDMRSKKDVARLTLPGVIRKLRVASSYVYAACADAGFVIVDVAIPTAPRVASTLRLAGFSQGLQLVDPYAFVVAANRAVYLVDYSDRYHPRLVTTVFESYYVEDAAAEAGALYLADGINGIRVYDISTVASPRFAGVLENVRYNGRLAVSGTYLYDSLLDGGIAIYDISDRFAPREVAVQNLPGRAADIDLVGKRLYVCNGGGGLTIVDVSNPRSPSILSTLSMTAANGSLSQSTYYVASDFSGLLAVDVSDPREPRVKDRRRTLGVARSLEVTSGKAYVADFHNGFSVLNISSPSAITLSSSLDLISSPLDAAVSGGTAYVACGTGGMRILSVSGAVRQLGTYSPAAYAVALLRTNAVVARGKAGIDVVDVANSAKPRRVASLALGGWVDCVVVRENVAYAGNGSDLFVIDLSKPAAPVISKQVPLTGTYGIAWQTRYLFAAGLGSLSIFDLGSPAAPLLLSALGLTPPQYVRSLSVSGGRAFLASRFSGIDAYDVSDRSKPVLLGSYVPGFDVSLVKWAKPYLYAGDGRDGGLNMLTVVGP